MYGHLTAFSYGTHGPPYHLDWIKGDRLSTGNRRGGTSCGFCASGGASRPLAVRAAQSKGHSPLMFIRGRFVSIETFQTAMAT